MQDPFPGLCTHIPTVNMHGCGECCAVLCPGGASWAVWPPRCSAPLPRSFCLSSVPHSMEQSEQRWKQWWKWERSLSFIPAGYLKAYLKYFLLGEGEKCVEVSCGDLAHMAAWQLTLFSTCYWHWNHWKWEMRIQWHLRSRLCLGKIWLRFKPVMVYFPTAWAVSMADKCVLATVVLFPTLLRVNCGTAAVWVICLCAISCEYL